MSRERQGVMCWSMLTLAWVLAWGTGCAGRRAPEAPATVRPAEELLMSVLWTQSAAEYRALTIQSYALARLRLDEALDDPQWTATLEATESGVGSLPPAVIVDVDETVLDNTAYQARLLLQGRRYDADSWNAWCRERKAGAVPGAAAFTRYAAERGVVVFYVTNRLHEVEAATRENLDSLGFPLDPHLDTIYTRGERPEWQSSDKTSRRELIATRYRVLLLIGDDLHDFLAAGRRSPEERAAIVERHREAWGRSWIVVPNPIYGSWEAAVLGDDLAASEDRRRLKKYNSLREQ